MQEEQLYRDLQRHLDRMPVGFPATESGVEIRILKQLFTPRDARIALCLSAIPEPVATIHKRIRREMSREDLSEALAHMAGKGLIERHGPPEDPRYGKSVFVVGIYERQLNRLTEQLERDVRQYFDEGFGNAVWATKTQQMRTVPINRTIEPERGIGQYDDVRGMVQRSEGPFAAMNCICRHGKDLLGEPCRQTSGHENCLTFGVAARAMVERGMARFLSREEMLERLDQADREGLVLQPQNTQDPLFVCCCCGCCCGVLTTAKKLARPADFFVTNYFAESDAAICQACGTCVTRCQMDAISTDDGIAQVDRTRCIGCGLCVSTCPSGAMRLQNKPEGAAPPKDTQELYKQIFRERYGPWGLVKVMGRSMFGLKI